MQVNREYRVFCKCIEDVVKLSDCITCPHYKNELEQYCTYTECTEEQTN